MSHPPILKPEAIEALRSLSPDGDVSFLRELIDIFLTDTPKQLGKLESALAAQNSDAVTRAAHTIKGSSGNFGATHFAQIAQQIENLGKANDLAAASVLLVDLKHHYALVVGELKRLAGGSEFTDTTR